MQHVKFDDVNATMEKLFKGGQLGRVVVDFGA
jgi:hypothetical protein